MYLDIEEIRDEYFELRDDISDRFDELEELYETQGTLTPAEFREYELIQGFIEAYPQVNKYELPAENTINPNTKEYAYWVILSRIDEIHTFCNEVGTTPDDPYFWGDVGPMIPEHEFTEYAQDFAYDIGAVNDDGNWPNYHIDWEAAARDLAMDYTLVEWEGNDYYVRSY
jgi:antirestriction protein